jgi:DNA-directed RNA polymerase specialized sigma subunit
MEAALVYRPHEHDETPFPVFARARIRGAILDSVRRGKYLDATLQPIDGIAEESETPNMEVLIDQLRTRKRIDRIAFETLSVEQAAVIDAYYSPESPSLATVALTLDLPEWRVYRAHAQALAILRRHLDAA